MEFIQLMCISFIKLLFSLDLEVSISCAIVVALLDETVHYQSSLPSENQVDIWKGKHLDSLLGLLTLINLNGVPNRGS